MIEKIAHYRVLNRLGAGGMGEVYLAEDTQLGRKVALKLLPREFTNDEVRVRRFTQEARAASALNHPNIITIYEIGRADGHQYIATEYIEGETVRRMVAYGRLKLLDALEIAIQTAQALEAAHRVGIIHRDIKPENIMRRPDGYIKILDFGLAKLTERASSSPDNETHSLFHTDPGTVLGTVAYMSPEQARGLAVDARTDVFSLGVVIYEMLTGKRPFGGATTSDVLVSILDREPPPLASHLPGIPAELEAIIKRALAKDVSARYASITDMLADLKRARGSVEAADEDALPTMSLNNAALAGENVSTIATNIGVTRDDDFATTAGQAARTKQNHAVHTIQSLHQNRISRWWWIGATVAFLALAAAASSLLFYRQEQINSIAILPFFNSSANQNAEYIGDGITEGLINTLSKLPELTVMSRNSVLRFRGREADAQEAGQSLGVRAVLLGQIKQEGDDGKNVVISAELVDARTRRQIWGDRFRRRSDDLLSVQDQIIRAIAAGLQLRLTNEQQEAINTRPTESGEAYELYMRGRYYWNQGTPEALKKADEYFERAADLDPKYALAIAGCAACHAFGANYDEPPSASMPKAKKVALVALKQNDKLASVHLVLARVAWMYDWDFATAERKFKRAIELDSGDPVAHAQYGEFLAEMGREGEAVAEIDRARALDPSSPRINQTAGLVYYYQRRYDPALTQLNAALKLAPKNVLALEGLGMVYEQQNLRPEAIEQYLKARLSADSQTAYLHALKGAYARGGWKAFWRQELTSWQDRAAKGYVPASKFAEINLRLDDHKQALFWLAKAYDERDGRLVALKIDPLYDPLRGEDRFKDILKRVESASSER